MPSKAYRNNGLGELFDTPVKYDSLIHGYPGLTMAQIRALAQKLAASANSLSDELESRGLGEYSFNNPNSPLDLPLLSAPGSAAQAELISAAEELLRLAHGPLTYLNRYQDVVSGPYGERHTSALTKIPQGL